MFYDPAFETAHTERVKIKRDGRIRTRKREPSPSNTGSHAHEDDSCAIASATGGNEMEACGPKADEPPASENVSLSEPVEETTSLLSGNHHEELESSDTPQSKVCDLIVDKMRIRQRLLYHKQRDTFVGDMDMGPELEQLAPTSGEYLVNSLLCFLLCGLYAKFKIPLFSAAATGAHGYLKDQAGHICDLDFASAGPTTEFMKMMQKWFTLMDVSKTRYWASWFFISQKILRTQMQ
ncbi:hypothetical protein HPB52_023597 [Rhipicephalus sanguineus]|uniref:Transposable element P transposase-like RNase H domain-containing protein n=1 Tax=Rhipicephalus sanguineus TaxID=34632 RepID=A0A9D4SV85_RHISA|nr:hypothetical protein HPB52_023597 [Rhipicephalus sanguineus]